MTNVTLVVPSELKGKMEHFPEINWSEVARQAFNQKISDLEFLEKIKSKSKITEKDAMRLGKEVSRAISNRLRKKAKLK